MEYLDNIYTPQMEKIHSGKVRESFRIDEKTRMIVVSDRISSFDNILNNLIPHKGAVLNEISNFWFERTKHIVDNHIIKMVDPNINLVKEAEPIRIEMIVRGYLTGSMWRSYKEGKRIFSDIKVESGLIQNQKFVKPILTPTTKEKIDREITPQNIVKEGWTSEEIYNEMAEISLELFDFGTKLLLGKGIILVDTKYEFGLIDGKLILIDEIHTPDSSRFWSLDEYQKNHEKVDSIDKEFVRQWLLENKKNGIIPDTLPDKIINETTERYLNIAEKITGKFPEYLVENNIEERIYKNLVKHKLIKDGYVAIIMGSLSDLEHADKLKFHIEKYDIKVVMRIVSAHKNGERIPEIMKPMNNSLEPGVVIAVAGRSNGLGGALAANSAIPVINCPPFKDKIDMMVNINSSLIMPSNTPATTTVDVSSAALAALRSLNLKRLKNVFIQEITDIKESLIKADDDIRKF